jgi:PAS domain S-box-containing protein
MERLKLVLENFSNLQQELSSLSDQLESEKENLFTSIVENTTSFIAIFQENKFVFANSQALILLKCRSSSDIIGQHIFDILHPQHHATIGERLERLKDNKPNEAIPVKFKTIDGSYIDIEASSIPFVYNGAPAVLLVGRDIANEVALKNKLLEEERLRNQLMKMHPDLSDFYTPDAIMQFDLDGRLVYISPSHEEFLGKTAESLIGKKPTELYPQQHEAGESIELALKRVIESAQPLKVDITYSNQTGKPRCDLIWLTPLYSENGEVTGVLSITRKVTALKEVEKKLEQSIERLNRAELIASVGHMEYDLTTSTRSWSTGALSILKATPGIQEKRKEGNYFDRIHPEDVDRIISEQRRSIEQDVPFDQMYRIIDFEGNQKMIHGLGELQYGIDGKPIKFLGIVQDVTKLFELNKRIKEEMDKYRLFINDAPVGVMLFIGENLRYANKMMLQLVDITNLNELLSVDRMEAVYPEDRNKIIPVIEQLQTQQLLEPVQLKIRIRREGMRLKHFNVILSSCNIGNENFTQVIVTDITSEVEKEEKVRQMAADAIYLGQKNNLLNIIEKEITQLLESKASYTKNDFQKILGIIKGFSKSEQDWELFKTQINELHPNFFSRLKEDFHCLTQHDIRHCAYIKLNFDTKEIARFFNVKPETIQMARVRLKKKMKLDETIDLRDFIIRY